MESNTKIHLWIEPLVIDHEKSAKGKKIYFNAIIDGDYAGCDIEEVDEVLQGTEMQNIMDYASIDANWNYQVISHTATSENPMIEITKSAQQIENEIIRKARRKEKEKEKRELVKKINTLVHSKDSTILDKKNLEIREDGMINVSIPELKLSEQIDFPKIWDSIEKNFLGIINEGDKVTLTDDNGNTLFELVGGSFLNVGIADLSVYDRKKMAEEVDVITRGQGLKGGLFIRDDGRLEIGDTERTFYMQIHTNNLLKASVRANKSLMEVTQNKLLNNKH